MRDLDATKQEILDAAEVLFAARGYDGVSVQEIATAAGVSRGMPGYAFGSKRSLYDAVLRRAFAQPGAVLPEMAEPGGVGLDDALRTAIERYIDFLADHPTFVALLQRAALDGGAGVDPDAAFGEPLQAALGVLNGLFEAAGVGGVDARHLVVSAIALCFFPPAHQHTVLRPLGLDAGDAAFLAQRKAHVADLLLGTLREDSA